MVGWNTHFIFLASFVIANYGCFIGYDDYLDSVVPTQTGFRRESIITRHYLER
jgi:hypothetical protein